MFDHEARRDALESMYRVLKPGGMLVVDHRNYDRMLDEGFSTKHEFYYTGDNVDARPVELSRTKAKFESSFAAGEKHQLTIERNGVVEGKEVAVRVSPRVCRRHKTKKH